MNTTQTYTQQNELLIDLMKLHPCATCSIRCRANARPRSIFARLHRWHMTWWPGWKIYLAEKRASGPTP